jgi:hypothetical protein
MYYYSTPGFLGTELSKPKLRVNSINSWWSAFGLRRADPQNWDPSVMGDSNVIQARQFVWLQANH